MARQPKTAPPKRKFAEIAATCACGSRENIRLVRSGRSVLYACERCVPQ